MKMHINQVEKMAFGLLCVVLWSSGCRDETFYGPFHLEIPNLLMERSDGRTFKMPLKSDDVRELDTLEQCLQNETDRTIPCECDYPVLTIYEYLIQLDYRLFLHSGQKADVLIWIGVEVGVDELYPDILPDLPRVDVIANHHHMLIGQGQTLDASFIETEIMEELKLYALSQYQICELDLDMLPVPTEIIFGMSIFSDQPVELGLDVTFRLREYK